MLSRAQSLSQIYIIEKLFEEKWRASASGLREYNAGLQNAINIDREEEKKCFEIVSMNILSLRKHHPDLMRRFERKSIDCLCLQETWLPRNDDAGLYKIRDMVPHLNSIGRGKGIATYSSRLFQLREFICEEDFQMMKVSSDFLDIINVYRSQGSKVFRDKMEFVVDTSRPTILCGDTNIDINGDKGKELIVFMKNLGLTQLVKKPTHDKGGVLDHVYVTDDLFEKVSVTQTGVFFSDHDLITIKLYD